MNNEVDRWVGRLIDWLIVRLIDWLIDRSVDCLVDWLIDWLIDLLIEPFEDWSILFRILIGISSWRQATEPGEIPRKVFQFYLIGGKCECSLHGNVFFPTKLFKCVQYEGWTQTIRTPFLHQVIRTFEIYLPGNHPTKRGLIWPIHEQSTNPQYEREWNSTSGMVFSEKRGKKFHATHINHSINHPITWEWGWFGARGGAYSLGPFLEHYITSKIRRIFSDQNWNDSFWWGLFCSLWGINCTPRASNRSPLKSKSTPFPRGSLRSVLTQ